ncbi:hypothetical protein [Archangium lansingense]|uniref:Uncharacterized protein n=1 Tax=Archangium lansingense TaxID=2995310 RepID=A0ABT4AGL1_9BACT|nr:hypothetical protein [Archangium lansinium]MCY1080314.1 hypothetical protein [Archangium lansinium]
MARLPFLQVPQQTVACARMLARALRVPEFQGIGLAVALDAWAVEMAPEGDLSGTLPPGDPAALLALAVGWEGDPAALLAALLLTGFLVRDGDTVRYVHLPKYEGALVSSPTRRSTQAKHAANARWSKSRAMPTDAPACVSMREHAGALPPDAGRCQDADADADADERSPKPPGGAGMLRVVAPPTPQLPYKPDAPSPPSLDVPTAVDLVHREVMEGRPYAWDVVQDERAATALLSLCMADGVSISEVPAEVARRFGRALVRSLDKYAKGSTKAVTLRELARRECWAANAERPTVEREERDPISGVARRRPVLVEPWDAVAASLAARGAS